MLSSNAVAVLTTASRTPTTASWIACSVAATPAEVV
jgi:hypothetical protein